MNQEMVDALVLPKAPVEDAEKGRAFVCDFLNATGGWFLATVTPAGDASVRPISIVTVYDGELVFSTTRDKDVYEDLMAHPQCAWSAWIPGHGWLRASCTCVPAADQQGVEDAVRRENPRHCARYLSADPSRDVHFAMRSCHVEYFRSSEGIAINV